MDLILWRHAEAEEAREGQDDLDRALTQRGEKQATRVGGWLDRVLPEGTRILCSPARRCEQTARALGRKYRIKPELVQGTTVEAMLQAAQWPDARQPVLLVGHQPVLGQVLARLLGMEADCPVRKGAAWWLRRRERDGGSETVVIAVQSADTA